ncbi:hypothetical protein U3516DRAFT_741901 [Neocallimastix sp. 'constans']
MKDLISQYKSQKYVDNLKETLEGMERKITKRFIFNEFSMGTSIYIVKTTKEKGKDEEKEKDEDEDEKKKKREKRYCDLGEGKEETISLISNLYSFEENNAVNKVRFEEAEDDDNHEIEEATQFIGHIYFELNEGRKINSWRNVFANNNNVIGEIVSCGNGYTITTKIVTFNGPQYLMANVYVPVFLESINNDNILYLRDILFLQMTCFAMLYVAPVGSQLKKFVNLKRTNYSTYLGGTFRDRAFRNDRVECFHTGCRRRISMTVKHTPILIYGRDISLQALPRNNCNNNPTESSITKKEKKNDLQLNCCPFGIVADKEEATLKDVKDLQIDELEIIKIPNVLD